jgi:hypothetical protein
MGKPRKIYGQTTGSIDRVEIRPARIAGYGDTVYLHGATGVPILGRFQFELPTWDDVRAMYEVRIYSNATDYKRIYCAVPSGQFPLGFGAFIESKPDRRGVLAPRESGEEANTNHQGGTLMANGHSTVAAAIVGLWTGVKKLTPSGSSIRFRAYNNQADALTDQSRAIDAAPSVPVLADRVLTDDSLQPIEVIAPVTCHITYSEISGVAVPAGASTTIYFRR